MFGRIVPDRQEITAFEIGFLTEGVRSLDDTQLETLISIAKQESERRRDGYGSDRRGRLKEGVRDRLLEDKSEVADLDLQFTDPLTEQQ